MKKIKPFTIKQVITWLKRQKKSATFHWGNGEGDDVCLFSKFMRYALKGKGDKYIIGNRGQLVKQSDYLSESYGVVIPFHEDFWVIAGRYGNVTRDEAIKPLNTISKMYASAEKHNKMVSKLSKAK